MEARTMTALQRTISPVDNSVYVERPLATGKQIDSALDRAVRAQQEWKELPIKERAALCLSMVEAFVARADTLGEELSFPPRDHARPHGAYKRRRLCADTDRRGRTAGGTGVDRPRGIPGQPGRHALPRPAV